MTWHVRIICTMGSAIDYKEVAAVLRKGGPGAPEWIGKHQDGAPVVSVRDGDVVLALRPGAYEVDDSLMAAVWGCEHALARFDTAGLPAPRRVNVSARAR